MIVETSDRAVAADVLGRSFPGLGLAGGSSGRQFTFSFSREDKGPLSFSRMRVVGVIRTEGIYPHEFAVARRMSGSVDMRYGRDVIDTTHSYLRPRGRSTAHFEDSRTALISFDSEAFRAAAERHLEGSGRRLVDPVAELASSSARGRRLWDAAAEAVAQVDGSSPMQVATLFDVAVAALLTAFPITVDDSTPGGLAVLPPAVKRATAYLAEHAAEPISVTQVADAARISVRSLQYAFRRHFGMSPLAYLEELRLAGAHAELLDADPTQTTVSAVAARWGFRHLGRFAERYRRSYGENPSSTLGG